jgi:hypothetical protein
VDCDDVMLLLAAREQRTMTAVEESRLGHHLEACPTCQTLATEPRDSEWRWLVRVPNDALDDRELPALPMIDPIIFEGAERLAEGGMGKITRAFDRRLGRVVAIKETLDASLHQRFDREVRITARLQHPAIVPIYEAGTFPDGSMFYAMRLVPGSNLHDALDAAPTLADRLKLLPHLRAVVDALAYAHANRVIHRDLKPGNVLVGEFGETVVIDWGLAKELDRDHDDVVEMLPIPGKNLTRIGSVIGTPSYMSPGQAAGTPADATDDVYALGAMLYQLLAGTVPYRDLHDSADAVIAATIAGPPTPLAQLAPEAPADLRAIAERAMARAKVDRYPTAKELEDELARFEAGQLLLSREYSLRELAVRWLRRHRRAAIVGLVGVVAVIALAIVWTRARRAEDELAIRDRGQRVTAVYTDVARQAAKIDHQLSQLEIGLEGLATAASWALAGPEPVEPQLFFVEDFADEHRRPLDFGTPSSYRWPVSVEHPVVAVAPGVDRAAVLPKIRRLAPLRDHIRDMVASAAGDPSGLDPNALLRSRVSPIDYAYVDLAEGVHYVWPGIAALRGNYDVRDASFYNASKDRRGTRWGPAYIDSTTDLDGDDLVMPCTKGVWSPSGEFLAVAGVEITVTKLVDTSMRLPKRETIRTSLVTKDGHKIIDSTLARKNYTTTGQDEAVVFGEFDLAEIAAAIRDNKEGVRELTHQGRPIVVAFTKLDALDWYYVVEIDAASL